MKRDRESADARNNGTMGDYMTKQGRPDLAKAFPNAMTNEQGDAELLNQDIASAPKATPVSAEDAKAEADLKRKPRALPTGTQSAPPIKPMLGATPMRRPLFARG